MRRIFALIAGLLAVAVHAASALLSPDQFTEEFRIALVAALPDAAITVEEPLHIVIKPAQGEPRRAFLNNAYDQYSGSPSAKADVIARYVASYVESAKESGPLNPKQIVAVIKDRAWAKEMRRSAKERGVDRPPEPVIEDLNDELIVVYAEDTPQSISYFSLKALQEVGVQKDQLRELAIENLRRILPPPEAVNGPLFSMLNAGGDYVPSLLLFDELWSADKLGVQGEVVIAIPTRDVLLFTGSGNKEGVKKLREVAKKTHADGPYSLTNRLFVYRGGKFQRF